MLLVVAPRLLADALLAVLEAAGVDVTQDPSSQARVALTTSGVRGATAEVVVELASTTGSLVEGRIVGHATRLEGLPAIVQFARGWPTGPFQDRGPREG